MLTKIKMFCNKMKSNDYACMYQYYTEEAECFIKLGRYEEAERCREKATKYLNKEYRLVHKVMEMA